MHEAARTHPEHDDVFTLGECITESYPSAFEGPDTLRSVVALYHGSFVEVARSSPDFDWDAELWETLTHELKHHLEWLAREDNLEGVDYVMEHDMRRAKGLAFDPFYYRAGMPGPDDSFVAEDRLYAERRFRGTAPSETSFMHEGRRWRVRIPQDVDGGLGDVNYLVVEAFLDAQGKRVPDMEMRALRTEVVLVRTSGLVDRLRSGLSRTDAEDLLEVGVEAWQMEDA